MPGARVRGEVSGKSTQLAAVLRVVSAFVAEPSTTFEGTPAASDWIATVRVPVGAPTLARKSAIELTDVPAASTTLVALSYWGLPGEPAPLRPAAVVVRGPSNEATMVWVLEVEVVNGPAVVGQNSR